MDNEGRLVGEASVLVYRVGAWWKKQRHVYYVLRLDFHSSGLCTIYITVVSLRWRILDTCINKVGVNGGNQTSGYVLRLNFVALACVVRIHDIKHRRRNRAGACAPPKFHKLIYKLLTTLCVVSDCAPPNQKVFPTPLSSYIFIM